MLERASRAGAAEWVLDAFGLEVRSDFPLIGAVPVDAPAGERGRGVHITTAERDDSPIREETLLERVYADGALGMRVSRLEDGSYLIEAPGHGRFSVADDGSTVSCDGLTAPWWRWHRPLFAQVLPLAATLNGLELVHASAVALEDRAVAFVADSGTGKSSLALALLARGAALVTDDVLALEPAPDGGAVLAHPGVSMANIAAEQLALLGASVRSRVGAPIGTSDKVHVEIANVSPGPLTLGAIFFLRRSDAFGRLAVEPLLPPDPRDLLGATFMPHIVTRQRLLAQLRTCAEIAQAVPAFRLEAPARMTAAELAGEVERHLAQAPAQRRPTGRKAIQDPLMENATPSAFAPNSHRHINGDNKTSHAF